MTCGADNTLTLDTLESAVSANFGDLLRMKYGRVDGIGRWPRVGKAGLKAPDGPSVLATFSTLKMNWVPYCSASFRSTSAIVAWISNCRGRMSSLRGIP